MINLFLANVLILYPLKTPNSYCFFVFRRYKMGTLVREGLTLKRLAGWGQFDPFLVIFPKMCFLKRERVKPCFFFVTYNIIISNAFLENLIVIPQVVQEIWRIFPSILTIFINFSDFLIFPCCKETNNVTICQMMSAVFYTQPTLNRLFNNCIKLYWY